MCVVSALVEEGRRRMKVCVVVVVVVTCAVTLAVTLKCNCGLLLYKASGVLPSGLFILDVVKPGKKEKKKKKSCCTTLRMHALEK
jgi:hypothetical protein